MFWRYSFSAAEKKLFLQGGHGEENPCRKPVLRILKALKEELHLEPLNSYHLKTILLHECEAKPQPSQWNYSHLGQRFLDLLHRLENCLEQSNCPHYFIRNLNLFGAFNRQICLDLARKVRGVRLQAGEVLFRLSTKAQRRIIMKQALGESLGKSLEQDLEQDAESLLQQDSMQVLLQALERALTQAMEQALRQAWWPVQGQNRQQLSLIEQAIQALKQALGPQMEAIGYEIAQPILQPLVQVVEQVLDQTVCQDLTLLQAQAFGTFLGQVVWQNALQAIGKGLVQARDQLAEFTYTFSYNFLLHEFSGRQ